MLEPGGRLEVVLPAQDYRARKVQPTNREDFDALIDRADAVRVLPFADGSERSFPAVEPATARADDNPQPAPV